MAKETRLYGLYEKRDGRWHRLFPSVAGRRTGMVRLCQSALLAYPMGLVEYERRLRPLSAREVAEHRARLEE